MKHHLIAKNTFQDRIKKKKNLHLKYNPTCLYRKNGEHHFKTLLNAL